MRSGRAAAAVLVMAALCASAGPAAAEIPSPEREARRHFDEAEAAYKAGRYAQALEKYQAGYAAKPLPGFLVNIAQCQRRLGDLKAARATYREFILVAPDSRLVPEVQQLLRRLDVVIADLEAGKASAQPEAASGDDVDAAELAPPPMLASDPAGPASPLATAPAPRDAPAARHSRTRWWLWGGIAAAAVAGGVAAGLALSAPGNTTIRAGSLGTLSR